MSEISTIGLDLAKNVFQVHGVDRSGAVVLRRQLRRGAVEKFFAQLSPCTVGVEACGTAHHWARVIGRYGHHVRLMPPAYVKPYLKRNKNDGRDAEGDLRGGQPSDHAIRCGEEYRAASHAGCSYHPGAVGAATHDDSQLAASGTE